MSTEKAFENSELLTAIKSMKEYAKYDLPAIDEQHFRTYILPELLKKNRGQEANFDHWINIIGNPHREIVVLDQTGQELFRVPPILSRLPTSIDDELNVSISGLVDIYAKKRQNEHPVAADMWFAQAVQQLTSNIHSEDMLHYLRNQLIIYTRYDIPTSELLGALDGKLVPKGLEAPAKPEQPKREIAQDALSAEDYDFEDDSFHDL